MARRPGETRSLGLKPLAEATGTQGHTAASQEPTGRDEKGVALFQLDPLAALHAVSQEDVALFA